MHDVIDAKPRNAWSRDMHITPESDVSQARFRVCGVIKPMARPKIYRYVTITDGSNYEDIKAEKCGVYANRQSTLQRQVYTEHPTHDQRRHLLSLKPQAMCGKSMTTSHRGNPTCRPAFCNHVSRQSTVNTTGSRTATSCNYTRSESLKKSHNQEIAQNKYVHYSYRWDNIIDSRDQASIHSSEAEAKQSQLDKLVDTNIRTCVRLDQTVTNTSAYDRGIDDDDIWVSESSQSDEEVFSELHDMLDDIRSPEHLSPTFGTNKVLLSQTRDNGARFEQTGNNNTTCKSSIRGKLITKTYPNAKVRKACNQQYSHDTTKDRADFGGYYKKQCIKHSDEMDSTSTEETFRSYNRRPPRPRYKHRFHSKSKFLSPITKVSKSSMSVTSKDACNAKAVAATVSHHVWADDSDVDEHLPEDASAWEMVKYHVAQFLDNAFYCRPTKRPRNPHNCFSSESIPGHESIPTNTNTHNNNSQVTSSNIDSLKNKKTRQTRNNSVGFGTFQENSCSINGLTIKRSDVRESDTTYKYNDNCTVDVDTIFGDYIISGFRKSHESIDRIFRSDSVERCNELRRLLIQMVLESRNQQFKNVRTSHFPPRLKETMPGCTVSGVMICNDDRITTRSTSKVASSMALISQVKKASPRRKTNLGVWENTLKCWRKLIFHHTSIGTSMPDVSIK